MADGIDINKKISGDNKPSDGGSVSSNSTVDSEYDFVSGYDNPLVIGTESYTKYPEETLVEIDHRKFIIEDLEALMPVNCVTINEARLESKPQSDKDRNYPFEPIPRHELRFFMFSPSGRCVFKATHHVRKKHNRWLKDLSFDVLFLQADGQFLFRVHKEYNIMHHFFPCDCCGNVWHLNNLMIKSAAVTAGEFGRKRIGRVDQGCRICCCGKQRFVLRDANLQKCLTVEAPSASLTKKLHKEAFECSLEYKLPNGNVFSTMLFKGHYKCYKAKSKLFRLCNDRAICDNSITTIDFTDVDNRLPVELKALVFASYFLFYHQFWEARGMCFCPMIFFYILLITIAVIVLII